MEIEERNERLGEVKEKLLEIIEGKKEAQSLRREISHFSISHIGEVESEDIKEIGRLISQIDDKKVRAKVAAEVEKSINAAIEERRKKAEGKIKAIEEGFLKLGIDAEKHVPSFKKLKKLTLEGFETQKINYSDLENEANKEEKITQALSTNSQFGTLTEYKKYIENGDIEKPVKPKSLFARLLRRDVTGSLERKIEENQQLEMETGDLSKLRELLNSLGITGIKTLAQYEQTVANRYTKTTNAIKNSEDFQNIEDAVSQTRIKKEEEERRESKINAFREEVKDAAVPAKIEIRARELAAKKVREEAQQQGVKGAAEERVSLYAKDLIEQYKNVYGVLREEERGEIEAKKQAAEEVDNNNPNRPNNDEYNKVTR